MKQWYGLDQILECIDILDEELDKKFKIRSQLVPVWKNFLKNRVDNFNRYPDMIDHGSTHICNVLNIFADWMHKDFMEMEKARKKNCSRSEKIKQLAACYLNAQEMFILMAAIFLHDVGMSYFENIIEQDGSKNKMNFSEIRDRHGELSYCMLLDPKRNTPNKNEDLLPGLSLELKKSIALVCRHHQKTSPIGEYDLNILRSKGKSINTETLENELKNDLELNMFISQNDIEIKLLAALIRILDSADHQYSRGGSIWLTAMKVKRNQRNVEECEKILENLKKSQIKTYIEDKKEYFSKQKKYYMQHCSIEKTWILDGSVIIKPSNIDIFDEIYRTLFSENKNITTEDIEKELKKNHEEIKKTIKEELELAGIYLYKETARGTIWMVNNITYYDKKQHYKKIKNVNRFNNYTRCADYEDKYKNYDIIIPGALKKSVIKAIVEGASNITCLIGPPVSAKSLLLSSIAKDLTNEKNDDCPQKNYSGDFFDDTIIIPLKNMENFVQSFIIQISSFLANNCNYSFFDQLRTENEVGLDYWDPLFENIKKSGKFLICFDDFNNLPNQNKNSIQYIFLERFFEKIKNSKNTSLLICSTRFPDKLLNKEEVQIISMKYSAFKDKMIDNLINRSSTTLNIKNSVIKKNAEIKRSIEMFIKKFKNFPILMLKIFQNNFDIKKNYSKEEIIEVLKVMETNIKIILEQKVFNVLGNDMERNLIKFLYKTYTEPFKIEITKWKNDLG